MKRIAIDSDTIDLGELAGNVRRGWRSVLAGLVGGAALAAGVLYFVPPRFSGTSSIVVRAQEGSSASLAAKVGGSLAGAAAGLLPGGLQSAPIETELQILSSRAIAGEAVDSLLLQVRLRSERRLAPTQVFQAASFPGSFPRQALHFQRDPGGQTYTVTGFGTSAQLRPGAPARLGPATMTLLATPLPEKFDATVYDREEAITRFQKRSGASKAGGEVIAVSYQADDSLTASAVPNLLVRRYLVRRKTTDRGINQRKVELLTAEVDSVEHELTSAEQALRRQQESSGIVDPVVVGKLELERAGELRKDAGILDVERGALSQLISQLGTGQLTSRQLAAFPAFLKSPGINDLLSQLSTLETKRLQLLATLTPEDPAVVAATQAIQNIESQIPPLARTYAATLDRQRADVGRQLDTLRSAIERLPAAGESSLRLQRNVLRLGTINAALRAQLVEARLAAIGEGGDVRLLDVAEPPRKVSFPQPAMTLAAGLGGGLVVGVVIAAFAGFYGRYVPDVRSIERQIGVPALALDASTPFIVSNIGDARALLVVPLDPRADTAGVAARLMRTAASRSLRGTVLDLSDNAIAVTPPNIDRLATEFDLVVVRLPGLATDATVGALRADRPVLFVASPDRIDRRLLSDAVESLQRMNVPCAGVVVSRSAATEKRLAPA